MLTALVLICSISVTPNLQHCTRENATSAMRVPAEFGHPATCFMQGQAFLAQTSIGQELSDNDRVKIVCVRKETIDASIPVLRVN
jgi:hypothetical protein